MDQQELQQQIALYYTRLSPEAQAIFSSMEWLEILKGISAKYTLTEEQEQTLGTETTLVMLGVISPAEYEDTVRNKMGMAKDVADKIYWEINDRVLKTIMVDLSATFQRNTAPAPENNTLIANEIDERFKKLPAVVREAINESDYKKLIYAIGKDQNLTIGQTDRLELTTADLMLGTVSNEKYVELIQTELGISAEKARVVIDAVNEKILKKIRSLMMTPPAPKLEKQEHAIMKGAGIEIVSTPNPLNLVELEAGKSETFEPAPAPIIGQKLAGSFKIESQKTEHSVENLSPTNQPAVKPITPKAYPPKADPYRLNPDE